MLLLPTSATDEQFEETLSVLNAVEWQVSDSVAGVNANGVQAIELTAEPSDVITVEAIAGCDEQLLTLAGLLEA
jgi:hypothetical protein